MSGKKHKPSVRACVIANARSEKSERALGAALPVLAAQGWDVTVRAKHAKGEAEALAHKAARHGYDPIVSCGGDGTLNEIVNALAGSDVAVGALPAGTEDVWCKELGISMRADVAAMQLVTAARARVDVGVVEVDGGQAHTFLLMAGLGVDGAILQHVSRSLKNRIGPLAVGVAAIEAVPALRTAEVTVRLDHVRWQGNVSQIIVGNTRRYGGFTSVTNGAYADDGLLDVCLFTTHDLSAAGRQLASLLVRQRPSQSSAEIYRASRIVVSATTVLPLQIDGSSINLTADSSPKYEFSVVPRGLTVLVPRTYNGALFTSGSIPAGTSPKNA